MEQLAQVGGIAGIAALIGIVFSFVINYRKGTTDKFSTQISGFQAQIQEMRADFREQIQALTSGFQAQMSGFQMQLESMQNRNDSSVKQWQDLYQAQIETNSRLTAKIEKLESKIEQLTEEIDKLRTENAELKGQLKEHYKLA